MIKYFKDLLATLKQIEYHLKLLSLCVKHNTRDYGDRYSISTKHWNDS